MRRWMRSRAGSSGGSNGHERSVAPEIERVSRLSRPGQPETARPPPTDHASRGRGAIAQRPMRSPREHDEGRPHERAAEIPAIVLTHGIVCTIELARVGGPEGEEVHHLDPTETPSPGEADAAANRRIVVERVGGRWIQHHERDERTTAIPPAPEAIAVAPVGA